MSQVISLCVLHNDGMLLHIMGVRVLLVHFGTGHSVALSNYTLFILPQ